MVSNGFDLREENMIAVDELAPNAKYSVNLDTVRIDPKWALRVPASFAYRKHLLPLCKINQSIMVACAQTAEPLTMKALQGYLDHDCTLVEVEEGSLKRALDRVYEATTIGASDKTRLSRTGKTRGDDDDAVAICDELFQAAILRGASDIHLVPRETSLVVQLRVDGKLEDFREIPKIVQPLVISRLKVLAGMDIAEKRSAQDGRVTTFYGTARRKLEMRAASLPTRYGERLTLRLLATNPGHLSLPSLGMREADLQKFAEAMRRPHGLVLLTGPTGSGKSTTLYVAIEQLLKTRGGNVITIEDPIEYEINGASQVEVDSADKVNFSKALRSVLRHDPDVVMIGEIRDEETANTAIKAALTGHLVFSTVHTNTSTGVVTRLIDMGVEPFLVAATLRLSVAQRLVRRLCPACRRQRAISLEESLMLNHPELYGQTSFEPVGCIACGGCGYTGRVGLFEMLQCHSELAKRISGQVNEDILIEDARKNGLSTLLDDGVAKILDGTTTVAEVTSAIALG
jgi:general secretion pathway protein E